LPHAIGRRFAASMTWNDEMEASIGVGDLPAALTGGNAAPVSV
jgi:hypothetical protein